MSKTFVRNLKQAHENITFRLARIFLLHTISDSVMILLRVLVLNWSNSHPASFWREKWGGNCTHVTRLTL